jgi:hypothetical protein
MSDLHARTQIKNAIKALVLTVTDFENRVYTNRSEVAHFVELPLALISTPREFGEGQDVGRSVLKRTLGLVIEIKASAKSNLDDYLDELSLKVEQSIPSEIDVGTSLWHAVDLVETNIDIGAEGESLIGVCELRYQITYMTNANDPTQTR